MLTRVGTCSWLVLVAAGAALGCSDSVASALPASAGDANATAGSAGASPSAGGGGAGMAAGGGAPLVAAAGAAGAAGAAEQGGSAGMGGAAGGGTGPVVMDPGTEGDGDYYVPPPYDYGSLSPHKSDPKGGPPHHQGFRFDSERLRSGRHDLWRRLGQRTLARADDLSRAQALLRSPNKAG